MDDYHRLSVIFSSASGRSSTHIIYCKQHSVRQNSEVTPNLKTLFTLGWPPYCYPETVEGLFSRAGTVKKVFLQENPGSVETKLQAKQVAGFSVGYVVFTSEKDLDNALKLCHSSDPIPCALSRCGLAKWSSEYMQDRLRVGLLEEMAEVGVACYDKQREEAELARKKKAGVPDEDGWITVTRKTPRISVSMSQWREGGGRWGWGQRDDGMRMIGRSFGYFIFGYNSNLWTTFT